MIIDLPKDEQVTELRTLWKEAFGDTDEFLDGFFSRVFSDNRCRCVTVDGKVAAALYWLECEYCEKKVAYLYAIATLKEYRGRGLCSALMRDTHSYLTIQGYALAMLVPANKELFSFYEKLGYSACTSVSEKTVCASGEKIGFWQIDEERYGALRRKMLPEGSVIQERENLVLLGMTAELYEGDGILFAAQRSDGLRIIELLGDVSAASNIVNSLGYEKGIVRTAGEDRPFAMCIKLSECKTEIPKYLGLAFDQ